MAIIYIDRGRRSAVRRWLVLGAAALALGGLLGTAGKLGIKSQGAAAASPQIVGAVSQDACCARAPSQVGASVAQPRLFELASPSDPARAAAAAVAQAQRYDECRVLAELDRLGARDQVAELYERDPTGALAAAKNREDQALRDPCSRIGPYELRQIDVLMREAAQAGNADAKFFLLKEEVRAAAELADTTSDAATAVSAKLAGEVETMARAGYRAAIDLARDMANSASMISVDPVHATAWRLVVLQLEHGSLPSDDELAGSGVLLELDADAAQRAQREAALLYAACCQIR